MGKLIGCFVNKAEGAEIIECGVSFEVKSAEEGLALVQKMVGGALGAQPALALVEAPPKVAKPAAAPAPAAVKPAAAPAPTPAAKPVTAPVAVKPAPAPAADDMGDGDPAGDDELPPEIAASEKLLPVAKYARALILAEHGGEGAVYTDEVAAWVVAHKAKIPGIAQETDERLRDRIQRGATMAELVTGKRPEA